MKSLINADFVERASARVVTLWKMDKNVEKSTILLKFKRKSCFYPFLEPTCENTETISIHSGAGFVTKLLSEKSI